MVATHRRDGGRGRSAGALLALVAIAGCAGAQPPNVIVVLIDALRADHLGCYGYERDTSPNIDGLARESLLFESVHAQSPWTKPSIPTLFTSLYPIQHGVYEGEARSASGALESDVLAQQYVTMAELFHSAGYATVAWVHNAHLQGKLGFAQGFDVYRHGKLDAEAINRGFLAFLDGRDERPFFAYLHYLDAHWPFQPQEPFRAGFPGPRPGGVFDRESWDGLRDAINSGTIGLSDADRSELVALHDGGIRALDHHLGRLLHALRDRRLLDHTVVLLTSDHGEELLDHGQVGHGGTLFREVIEIPLLIRLPGGSPAGRVSGRARLLDVLPTLLGIAGIERPAGLQGRDLLAAPGAAPELVAETRHKRTYRVSIRRGDWKLVRTYHARRAAAPGVGVPTTRGLAAGMRVKAKGLFTADGALLASKLSIKDPSDDDLELSGPVERVLAEEGELRIRGFRVLAGDVLGADGRPLAAGLAPGDWVKVEGEPGEGRTLRADEIERLGGDDHDEELEAIVRGVEELPGHRVRLALGNAEVLVTKDTRIKGAAPPPVAAPRPDAPGDPFSASRLLSSGAPPFDEQLFDLSADPGERVDLASSQPGRLAGLGEGLRAWLARMARHDGARVGRHSLDSATVEELRSLGYLE